jgi:alpha-glucosidase
VLITGDNMCVKAAGEVVHFVRSDASETLFVAVNLSDQAAAVSLPAGVWTQIGVELGSAEITNGSADLAPWQVCLAVKS